MRFFILSTIVLLGYHDFISGMSFKEREAALHQLKERKNNLFKAIKLGDVSRAQCCIEQSVSYGDNMLSEYSYLQSKIRCEDSCDLKQKLCTISQFFSIDVIEGRAVAFKPL